MLHVHSPTGDREDLSGVSLTHDVCTRVHAEMELDGYRKTNNDAESPQLNRAGFVQPCCKSPFEV